MIHIIVTGDVQGVGFRQFIRYQARKLNVKGWVKNLPDGNVEAVFAGEAKNVEKMIKFAENGPMIAEVKSVDTEEIPDESFEAFEILK